MQDVISLSTGFVRKVEGVTFYVVDSRLTIIMGALNAGCYLQMMFLFIVHFTKFISPHSLCSCDHFTSMGTPMVRPQGCGGRRTRRCNGVWRLLSNQSSVGIEISLPGGVLRKYEKCKISC